MNTVKPVSGTSSTRTPSTSSTLLSTSRKRKRERERGDVNKNANSIAQKESARQKTILQYEELLNKIKMEIEKCNLMEVDFDDESENSPYQRKAMLTAKFVEFYKILCKATGCNSLTGRPIEKTINLSGVTPYEQLNEKIAKYINHQSISYVPDFKDILNVVQHENAAANQRFVHKEEEMILAQKFHSHIMKVLRTRRHQDLYIAIPDLNILSEEQDGGTGDPADHDEILLQKLKANRNVAMTENQVIQKFLDEANALPMNVNESGEAERSDSDEDSESEDRRSVEDDFSGNTHSRYDADEILD